ncbi:MAG: penicillin-insensitive murein endopeptidase [Sandaracinaceae bacterium]
MDALRSEVLRSRHRAAWRTAALSLAVSLGALSLPVDGLVGPVGPAPACAQSEPSAHTPAARRRRAAARRRAARARARRRRRARAASRREAAARAEASAPSAGAGGDSRSIGAPDRGRLEHGARIVEAEGLHLLSSGHEWGTRELVDLLTRSASRLYRAAPGPRVLVGALSRASGGRVPPHSSHQSGRDADVGLFLTDEQHAAVEPDRFVALGEDSGCGADRERTYCLDAARTFRFLVTLIEDETVEVQWVLIAADLRELILAAGRRADVEPSVLERVATITELRGGSASHRSHLHVRIVCPENDRPRCRD